MIQYKNQRESKVGDQVVFRKDGTLMAGKVIQIKQPDRIIIQPITQNIEIHSYEAMHGDDALKFQPDI